MAASSTVTCRRTAGWAGAAALAVALALALPAAAAGPPSRPPGEEALRRDVRLTFEARRALRQDWVLARFNLGVTARDGTATLWGPVTTEALARRAVERVSEVPGVYRVRNEMWVSPNWDPPAEPAEAPPLPLLLDPPPGARTPAALAAQPRRPGPAPGKTSSGPPKPFPGDSQALRPPLPEEPHPPAAVLGAPVTPQPPEAPPAPPTPPESRPHKPDLAALLAEVQQADVRRADVRVQAQDGVVYLQSRGASVEVVYAFAEAVSRLPGVKQVVIQAPR